MNLKQKVIEIERRIEKLEELEERRRRNLQEMIAKNEEAQKKYEERKAIFR